MTVVVDASVLVSALVDSGGHAVWAEAALTSDSLDGPESALAEASNILRRLERAGMVSQLQATSAHQDLLQLDLELFPFTPFTRFADRVWALRNNLTSSDAWYVALAEALDCPPVTLDRRLSRATGPRCRILVPPHREAEETT